MSKSFKTPFNAIVRPAFLAVITMATIISSVNQPAWADESTQYQWQRTNPGGGGAVNVLNVSKDGTIIAGSDLSGAYISDDNGEKFSAIGNKQGLMNSHIASIGVHPHDNDIFVLGTSWGAYITEDGGENFTVANTHTLYQSDASEGYIEDIHFAASNPSVAFMAFHEDSGMEGQVLKSIDGGHNWGMIDGNNFPSDVRIVKIMVHPADENLVFALGGKTRWKCSAAYLYTSTDGGVNWTRIADGANTNDDLPTDDEILDFDLNPANTEQVYISTFKSQYKNKNKSRCDEVSISGDEDSYIAEEQQYGRLYRIDLSTNTATALSSNKVTGAINVNQDNTDHISLFNHISPEVNAMAGMWRTTDAGFNWEQKSIDDAVVGWSKNIYYSFAQSFNGLSKTVRRDPFRADHFVAAFGQWGWHTNAQYQLINISTKAMDETGDAWRSTGLDNINGHVVKISPSNPNTLYMGTYDLGLWVSLDKGVSWHKRNPSEADFAAYVWDGPYQHGANVTSLAIDPDDDAKLWAVFHKGTFDIDAPSGAISRSALLYSEDHGKTWVSANQGLPDSVAFYDVRLTENDSAQRQLLITAEGDVYRSSNAAGDWSKVLDNGAEGYLSAGFRTLAIDAVNPNIVYAGGELGIWRSEQGGDADSWVKVSPEHMQLEDPSTNNLSMIYKPQWQGVFKLLAHPSEANTVFATFYEGSSGMNEDAGGLYKSIDKGSTWSKLYNNAYMRDIAILEGEPERIYLSSSKAYYEGADERGQSLGILLSEDHGQNWINISNNMPWTFGGDLSLSNEAQPYIAAWSPGTGVQMASVPIAKTIDVALKSGETFTAAVDASAQASSAPKQGTLSIDAGQLQYTANAEANGEDAFSTQITNTNGTLSWQTYQVTFTDSPEPPPTEAENQAPQFQAVAAQNVAVNTALDLNLVATDADSDPLTYSISVMPQHGNATIDAQGALNYTAATNYIGADTLTATVSDGKDSSHLVITINVNVNAENAAPIIQAIEPQSINEDSELSLSIIASDADNEALSYSISQAPANGTATMDQAGLLIYAPTTNFNGLDKLSVMVSDGQAQHAISIDIKVNAVNDAPIISAVAQQSIKEDSVMSLSINASDVDDGDLNYAISQAPEHGTATIDASGQLSYTPSPNYNGLDSLNVSVNDDVDTAITTVEVAITPVSDAPTLKRLSSVNAGQHERINLTLEATDADNDAMSYAITAPPSHGKAGIKDQSTVAYEADGDYVGSDSFDITVTDATGLSSAITVELNIEKLNASAPVSVPDIDAANINLDLSSISSLDGKTVRIYGGEDASLFVINGTRVQIANEYGASLPDDHNNDGTYVLYIEVTDQAGQSEVIPMNLALKQAASVGDAATDASDASNDVSGGGGGLVNAWALFTLLLLSLLRRWAFRQKTMFY